ncbi:MAG: tRNA preQ1(34) S-adenosylmethionine ribosyltransferase-isomerase QueA [Cardiobacteriaceae bacterium]|nr:tRNA preQ1(34) S-adenosylmethionine ribosyltransferase-isomerase QueA [Cardiobacteriaceae bacterium]
MHYSKSDFFYDLPENQIARFPTEKRSAAKLLICDLVDDKLNLSDTVVENFYNYLRPNDLLIFNNTKVIPARIFAQKESGGRVEILVERYSENNPFEVSAFLRASKSPKAGSKIIIDADGELHTIEVLERNQQIARLKADISWREIMNKYGQMPIPPYLERNAQEFDNERYQTVYAKNDGAVAAPTAGLHFDLALLEKIKAMQIDRAEITLHIGAGTFQPVREEDLTQHKMHFEWIEVNYSVVEKIRLCKRKNGRVIAIGTTSLRAIESAAKNGKIAEFQGDTNLFITPGYQFQVVDALFTNFHLPESTLIMLVSAFLGFNNTKKAYQYAVENNYRFFSYGDAMFIPKRID